MIILRTEFNQDALVERLKLGRGVYSVFWWTNRKSYVGFLLEQKLLALSDLEREICCLSSGTCLRHACTVR